MEEWYKSKEITSLKSRYCSVNYRHVSYALGVLILVEAGLFFVQLSPSITRKRNIFTFCRLC